MPVTLRQLDIFRTVARTGSYTRAAEELHLTQPAVFAQVRQLEEHLQTPLIERIGKMLHLTVAGETVLASARTILDEVASLEMRLADLKGLKRGRLALCIVSTAKYDIPGRLGPFSRANPGIDIALTVGNREELLARFAANEDDLYILGTVPETLQAEWRPYAANPLVVVAAPEHRLAGRKGLGPEDIASEPFILRESGSGTRAAMERYFDENGIAPPVTMELGANEAVKEAVRTGLGLSVVSRGSAELELETGRLVALDIKGFPILRHWHVAWPRGKRLSPAAEAFLDMLAPEQEIV
ncbi:LysR family transcriptional regulator [Ruegeria marisrubri]|uniref:HTH-type transcriptional regulator CbbR n=1 Tax=Ruegeria marisrubri TaxID=1685379 RepID=A0A0X3UI98_9RHOB|nr:LysR family transcriptional regulator [Ruegeria marisrubri]KUJ85480.1 LysR family transcriptional regulator [Ruegeria marisrubri]